MNIPNEDVGNERSKIRQKSVIEAKQNPTIFSVSQTPVWETIINN